MTAAETFAEIARACTDEPFPGPSGDRVFAEPWQAQVFAMTVRLHEAGHFSWPEWARTLGARLADSDDPSGSDYYRCWTQALIDLLEAKGLIRGAALLRLEEQWHSAAARTPHGQPIRLETERLG